MSNSQQTGNGNVTTRKKRRGMIEKRRRDKINNSLSELKRLVPAAFEKQGSAKLEKAEILQMTVDYLRMLHARGLAGSLTSTKQLQSMSNEDLSSSNQSIQLNGTNSIPYSHPVPPQHSLALSGPAQRQQQHQIQQPFSPSDQTSNALSSTNQNDSNSVQQATAPDAHQLPVTVAPSTPVDQSEPVQPQAMTTTSTLTTPSVINTSSSLVYSNHGHSHHHYYNQHPIAAAAAAYHHLGNPLGAANDAMAGMISQHAASNGTAAAATTYHDQHGQSQGIKNQLKIESHHHHPYQPHIVIPTSPPDWINLDHHHGHHHHHHHHGHHQAQPHHAQSYLFKTSW